MKLNMHILQDSLEQTFRIAGSQITREDLWLDLPLLHDHTDAWEESSVYVVRGADTAGLPLTGVSGALVLIGPAPLEVSLSHMEYLVLDESESPEQVYNTILKIFLRYRTWHEELFSIMFYEQGIQALFDASVPIFENPLFFHDADFRIVAFAEDTERIDIPDIYGIAKTRHFDQDTVSALKYHPDYQDSFAKTEPEVWSGMKYDFNTLYANVTLNGEYYGRIGIDERIRPYRKSDFSLLREFCQTVELAVKRRSLFSKNNYRFYEQSIIAILGGDQSGFENLVNELETIGWRRFDSYFCMVIQVEERDIIAHTLVNACDQIEAELRNARAFPYDSKIFVIGNLENERQSDFLIKTAPILREGLFKAGYSQVFHDIYLVKDYYTQALIALKTGVESGDMQWVYRFEDYILNYFLNCCSAELPASLLSRSELLKLIEYDKSNNTSFYETLQVYLENDSSPTKTMKALFIHRSTLTYRLERIKELLSLDIEDKDTKLYLLILFRLIEGQPQEQ